MLNMFSLNLDASIDRTFQIGTVFLSPRRLVERFGPPADGDDYKVTGTYIFEDAERRVYTVYDWKQTSHFGDRPADELSEIPTPQDFWQSDDSTEFMIGGRKGNDVERFAVWLTDQLDL